ncbi:SMI1/KNR4 family protein [Streptomyces sp. NPDC059398]|uniref:SMI1/KNR4 family protein n=1 Tax=Streptomyces sp. NPDC059398 TaxID=3346820 RepID=UPI0036AD4FCC
MTRALESSEKVIALVCGNEKSANHADGCDVDMLDAAEREMGLVFPPSYRRLLEEFGTWEIAGKEFFGVYKSPAGGDALLGTVEQTLEARHQIGLPADLMVVMVDDVWAYVVLDTSQGDQDGECPVFAWNPGLPGRDSMERVGGNFGSFALEECQRAMST